MRTKFNNFMLATLLLNSVGAQANFNGHLFARTGTSLVTNKVRHGDQPAKNVTMDLGLYVSPEIGYIGLFPINELFSAGFTVAVGTNLARVPGIICHLAGESGKQFELREPFNAKLAATCKYGPGLFSAGVRLGRHNIKNSQAEAASWWKFAGFVDASVLIPVTFDWKIIVSFQTFMHAEPGQNTKAMALMKDDTQGKNVENFVDSWTPLGMQLSVGICYSI